MTTSDLESTSPNAAASHAAAAAREAIWRSVASGEKTTLVDSPPGAGKSTLVRDIGRRACHSSQVPIIVQTNDQADDMVRGFSTDATQRDTGGVRIGRLHKQSYAVPADIQTHSAVVYSNNLADLASCGIIISTAAKWATLDLKRTWPFIIIDEAYQMRSDALLPVGMTSESLLLVGDPGQLSPFTTADMSKFRGRALSPLETAATTILTSHPNTARLQLPVSWRLPNHSADVIARAFYEHHFQAGTAPGQRYLESDAVPLRRSHSTAAVDQAVTTGWSYLELEGLPMPTNDPEAVTTIADIVATLLTAGITTVDENGSHLLSPSDIAVGVTHVDQREHVRVALQQLPGSVRTAAADVTVETANVLQGREFEITVVWHPLSGRLDASEFHLDPGRLCVLLSRHRQACIVVSRGGIRSQLIEHPPTEPVWLGETGPPIDGWHSHLSILDHLERHRVELQ